MSHPGCPPPPTLPPLPCERTAARLATLGSSKIALAGDKKMRAFSFALQLFNAANVLERGSKRNLFQLAKCVGRWTTI